MQEISTRFSEHKKGKSNKNNIENYKLTIRCQISTVLHKFVVGLEIIRMIVWQPEIRLTTRRFPVLLSSTDIVLLYSTDLLRYYVTGLLGTGCCAAFFRAFYTPFIDRKKGGDA